MDALTKTQVESAIKSTPDDAKFCPTCLAVLKEAEEDDGIVLYCPNESCLEASEYDRYGNNLD